MVILTAFYESDDAEQNNYGYYYNRYNNSCTHISCSLLGMLVFYLISIHYNANVYELSEKCLRNINMKVFSVKISDFFNARFNFAEGWIRVDYLRGMLPKLCFSCYAWK